MKVKILKVTRPDTYSECYCEDVIKGITDWEEVSKAQYEKLIQWAKRKSNTLIQWIIACQGDFNIIQTIADIERLIDEELLIAKKVEATRLKAAKTRAAKRKEKKEEKDKKELKRLKGLYDS